MTSESLQGHDYQQMHGGQEGPPFGQYGDSPPIQGQYPAGPAMSTFGGGTPFAGGMATGHGDPEVGHGHGEGGHGHGPAIAKDTGESPRRCTDLSCVFGWLICMIGALAIIFNASQHGNVGRLVHGVDYYGRTCGVDAGVSNMPFLFWCRSDPPNLGTPSGVDLDNPVCVATCPTSKNFSAMPITCLRPATYSSNDIPGGQFGNVRTQVVQLNQRIIMAAPYPTTPRGGRYCVPQDPVLRDQVEDTWFKALGPFSPRRILTALGTLTHLYWLLIISTVLAIALGYAFLYAMKFCPKTVAYLFIVPMAVFLGLMAFGFFFAWVPKAIPPSTSGFSRWYIRCNPFYKYWDINEATVLSFVSAVLCTWIAMLFCLMAYKFDGVVIGDLVSCAFECYKTVPMMTFQPAVEAIFKFIVFWLGINGLKIIASEGWIEKNRIIVNGASFAGLSRDYKPSVCDVRFYLMAIFWCFLWGHAMEICNAFGQFLVSYEVFKYYGVKKDKNKKPPPKPTPLFEGFKYGFIYHFGSILKGAFSIPFTRPQRLIFWTCRLLFPQEGDKPTSTAVCLMQNIATCGLSFCKCCGLASCCSFEEYIRDESTANKDGYHDVVIRSNDFDPAVKKGHALLEHSHPIVQYLYKDIGQTTVTTLGVLAISSITSSIVYLFVVNLPIYYDPASSFYIADPPMVTFLAWVLSAYQAFGFMTIWDQAADGLLYCYAWSRMWDRKTVDKYIPESLRYIVGFDDTDNDRYPYYGRAKNNMYLRYWLPMVGMEGGPKKEKPPTEKKNKSMMGTGIAGAPSHAPPMPSEPQGSWMSGYGTGFGNWGRQEQAISSEVKPLMAG